MAESTLSQRIKAEFDARTKRAKESEETRAKEVQAREQRMATFDKVCQDLRAVWRPRLEEFAQQFGEQVKLTPTITPSQREVKVAFLTELANITLTLTVSADPSVTKLVLDYDLLIIPIYFE